MSSANTTTVYLIHPESPERERLRTLIAQYGFPVREFASAESFLGVREDPDAGCLVIGLGGRSAGDLLEKVRAKHSGLPVILIAEPGGVPAAVQAMRAGANAYLENSVALGALMQEIRRAVGIKPDLANSSVQV